MRSPSGRKECERLVHEHYRNVYGYLFRLCSDRERAKDLCQETFAKVWRNLDGFQRQSSGKRWIFTIARNTFLESLRGNEPAEGVDVEQVANQVTDSAPLPRERLEKQNTADLLEKALLRLPEIERTAVLLHYQEGLTYRKVAQVLGTRVGTAKSHVHRGILNLRRLLTGQRE